MNQTEAELKWKQLTECERVVLRRRYGLGDDSAGSVEEVARVLRLTTERVHQIEREALAKLNDLKRKNIIQSCPVQLNDDAGGPLTLEERIFRTLFGVRELR